MSCVTLVKAALARFLFGLHTLVTVWRVVSQEEDSYWKLAIGILVLALEGFHALCYRKGEELSWFCPSVFIYLASIVPAIWILELKTNRREMLCLYLDIVQNTFGAGEREKTSEEVLRSNMILEIMQIKGSDLEDATNACRMIKISQETRDRVFATKEEGLKEILDINLNIALKPEQWTKILEQIVLVVLILGRWLLPKGRLTRDQFSQLMLVYIGMAADIVEVFEAFRESKVMLEPTLTYAILGVWSWSLLQFCLVLGGGHRGRKARMTSPHEEDQDQHPDRQNPGGSESDEGSKKRKAKKKKKKRRPSAQSVTDPASEEKKKRLTMDMIMIATALILQDLPFFCLRMTLIFGFGVISHMNIFFTCKNTLVILLQMYRLLVLCLERRPQYRRQSRLFSLIPAMSYAVSSDNDAADSDHGEDSEMDEEGGEVIHEEDEYDHDAAAYSKKRKKSLAQNGGRHLKKDSFFMQQQTAADRRVTRARPKLKLRTSTVTTTASEEIPLTTSDEPDSFQSRVTEQQLKQEIERTRRPRRSWSTKEGQINASPKKSSVGGSSRANVAAKVDTKLAKKSLGNAVIEDATVLQVNRRKKESRKISKEEIDEIVKERHERWRRSHDLGKKSRTQTLI